MKLYAAFIAAACAACAPSLAGSASTQGEFYHYVRSNRDGSSPEQIWVYLPDERSVEVVKIVRKCADAAYVTASLDPVTGSAESLIAGRLAEDGSQSVIGSMLYDRQARSVSYSLGGPEGPSGEVTGVSPSWHLYDYDMATLVAQARYRWPVTMPQSFDMVRLMPNEDGELVFERLGAVELEPMPENQGRVSYRTSGDGLRDGSVERDAGTGTVLRIKSSERNHLENYDFSLRFVSREAMIGEEWLAKRRSHWAHCPSG